MSFRRISKNGTVRSKRDIVNLGNIVNAAPTALDTLEELAAALNNDANAYTTLSNLISSGDSTTLSSAQTYTDTAESNAISTAASDATTKANTAESNAISTAASDATTKANTAESNANTYTDDKAANAVYPFAMIRSTT